jgi:hypothetical protein
MNEQAQLKVIYNAKAREPRRFCCVCRHEMPEARKFLCFGWKWICPTCETTIARLPERKDR